MLLPLITFYQQVSQFSVACHFIVVLQNACGNLKASYLRYFLNSNNAKRPILTFLAIVGRVFSSHGDSLPKQFQLKVKQHVEHSLL